MEIGTMLDRLAETAMAGDGAGFAALFSKDGFYDDFFFGPHKGREAIAGMLERFSDGGEAFCWQFTEPLAGAGLAYATYAFSYRSKEPESAGRLIAWEAMVRLRLAPDGLIAHYAECFDRGGAFTALGYHPDRVAKLLTRYTAAAFDSPSLQQHLAYRTSCGLDPAGGNPPGD